MTGQLTDGEKQILLRLAREAMEHGVRGMKLPLLDKNSLTPVLLEDGASFVTLTIRDNLRGCIGALEAYQPLAEDVREHAVAAVIDQIIRPARGWGDLHHVKAAADAILLDRIDTALENGDLRLRGRIELESRRRRRP